MKRTAVNDPFAPIFVPLGPVEEPDLEVVYSERDDRVKYGYAKNQESN
jgi:hypothetical protein